MRLLLLPILLLLSACAGVPKPGSDTVFIVVRHAEKAAAPADDPPLSEAGRARAQALATLLADVPLSAIYSTPTRRTRETARPVAAAKGLEVREYDGGKPPTETVTVLHLRHVGQQVLVVGHSNTVPMLVSTLCACPVPPIDETVYGQVYEVRIRADGETRLSMRGF
ncbi:histidine phosphatase family protein [Luteimonas yindakuii]|uniref:SixA phosphatase family protein n=1 Tax=Luteimonas yindakuii TaxID=2565782 RepID=UPI0011079872|nr:histidine phosphatase family protein [Luteimonas yindakuii]QCU72480.1 histidine phosphatase family protein [Luteimonas yindakuii]